jgi:hypothetical protein
MTKDEDVLKFVPPVTNGNSIFYINNNQLGYFEQSDRYNDSPVTYKPKDPIKERYRKEWFNLIIRSLNSVDFKLEKERDYNRYKDLEY